MADPSCRFVLVTILISSLLSDCVRGKAHQDDGPDNSEELAKVERRVDSIYARDMQYDGMAIDMGTEDQSARKHESARRHSDSKKHKSRPSRSTVAEPADPMNIPLITPANTRRSRRVYNADETVGIENYPFMAALLVNDQLWCGAAIIAEDRVLTAAHCLQLQYNNRFFREYVRMLSVRVGSNNATSGGEVYSITDIYFHPNYKPDTLEFNYAVVKLNQNISKSSKANLDATPIVVSQGVVPNNKNISILGWGSVFGDGGVGSQVLLQKVDLPVYDLADCQEVYGKELVTRNNFCAGYITRRVNVCNHDAGGPAIMSGELVGILSFSSKRCDELDKPAVFSSVGPVHDWIRNVDKDPRNKFGLEYARAPVEEK